MKIKCIYIKIRVEVLAMWQNVETDGIVYISCQNGEVGSIKMFGCFSLCHIPAFILKCIILLLYVSMWRPC